MQKSIVITAPLPGKRFEEILSDRRFTVSVLDADSRTNLPDVLRRCNPDGIVSLLSDKLDATTLAGCTRLKVISNYAVGYNNIDTVYAKEKGIIVTNTPDVLTEATADIAILLMLSVSRRAWEAECFMREGRFRGWLPDLFLGTGIQEKKLGIIGYGRIGAAVARRAKAMGMQILYFSRRRLSEEQERTENISYRELDDLISESDVISLHLPYTPEARHIIDARRIARMKQNAILINTARGPLVDETALLSALKERRIFGAGFDVYEHEPQVDPDLLRLSNVSVLPHIGSATVETRSAMTAMAIDDCVAVLTGGKPRHRVA